ncbi:MAG: hypothetical protein KDN18_10600, partial [Verrucomicrobiae bacterium]|nr:hypothetical protein [Verrucomicrobiae bacterium]
HRWREALGAPTPEETRFFLSQSDLDALTKLETHLTELLQSRPTLPLTLAVRDTDAPLDLAVHPGGNPYSTEGDPVPRGNP